MSDQLQGVGPGKPGQPGRTVRHPGYRPGAVAGAQAGRGAGAPGRRTLSIQGRGAERALPRHEAERALPRHGAEPALPRHGAPRPTARRHERAGFRPDRAARWAVMLGVLLVLVAVASAHP